MKKMLLALALFLCISYASNSQTTYYWVGALGSATVATPWSTSTNWNTAADGSGSTRTTASITDNLIISGKTNLFLTMSTDSVASLSIINSTVTISHVSGTELLSAANVNGGTVGTVAISDSVTSGSPFAAIYSGNYVSSTNSPGGIAQVVSKLDDQHITIVNENGTIGANLYRIPTLILKGSLSIDAASTLYAGSNVSTAGYGTPLFSLFLAPGATGNVLGKITYQRNGGNVRFVAFDAGSLAFNNGSIVDQTGANPGAFASGVTLTTIGPIFGNPLGTGFARTVVNNTFAFNVNAASVVFNYGSKYVVGATYKPYTIFGAYAASSPLVFSPVANFQLGSTYTYSYSGHYVPYFYSNSLISFGNLNLPLNAPSSSAVAFRLSLSALKIDTLTIGAGATFGTSSPSSTNSGNIGTIYGSINCSFTGGLNFGSTTLGGSVKQKLTSSTGISFNNLTVNNVAGADFIGTSTDTVVNLTVTSGTLTVGDGSTATTLKLGVNSATSSIGAVGSLSINSLSTMDLNSKFLTLQSTAAGTARINQINGTLSNATNVTTQVYIPGGRRTNRFLGHPFSTALSMSSLIDNIFVTGSGAGFDATTTNNPSAFWFNNTTQLWTPFTSTTDASWTQFTGIRTLIRGDRIQSTSLTGGNPTPNAVTLDMSGSLNVGIQNIALPVGYSVIGNPYPSPVNIGARLNATANIGTTYYVWNANGGVSAGSYTTKTIGATAYNLAMNGAFVVNPASATTINFVEADKQTAATSNLFRNTTKSGLLELQVLYNDYPADNMFIRFNKLSKVSKDDLDGDKLTNPEVNFYAISADNKKLSLDTRPFTDLSVIPLGLTATKANSFKIKVADKGLDEEVYLNDKFMNTVTKLEDGTEYAFDITPAAASQGENRFELMLKKAPVMALIAPSFTVKLSPNPASDMLKVSFTNAEELSTTISITDVEGKLVKTVDAGNVQSGQINVSVKSLAKGSYYITLNNGKENKTEKFQVQ